MAWQIVFKEIHIEELCLEHLEYFITAQQIVFKEIHMEELCIKTRNVQFVKIANQRSHTVAEKEGKTSIDI